ncbi:hypothetical protein LY78DRAFT_140578 [Colletotrichum sublineola]|nr:hypothetical protein LY78DRAFT_140578 [Colletotrichum sublineola]
MCPNLSPPTSRTSFTLHHPPLYRARPNICLPAPPILRPFRPRVDCHFAEFTFFFDPATSTTTQRPSNPVSYSANRFSSAPYCSIHCATPSSPSCKPSLDIWSLQHLSQSALPEKETLGSLSDL